MKRPNKPLRFTARQHLLAVAVAACFVVEAQALPVTPTVVNGTAGFATSGNTLTVTNSPNAIINWQKFGIAAGETTKFIQTSASSAVLNQVVGTGSGALEMSKIYGTLSSNGRVWLVNPAGIMVGPGGIVDTAGFVASTLKVKPEDFLAGRLVMQAGQGAGDVINQGTIKTPLGGSVYLVGTNVTNESVAGVDGSGIITTPGGETILAAGATVNLIDTGTPGVKVEITGAANNATNLGQIVAEAGRIGIAGSIVRNTGTLNASSVVNEGGRVFLKASQDTYVDGNGRIAATGTKGGKVEVLGNRVAVTDNAEIDASGTNGGGVILIGGDYQGKNPDVQNAQITDFGKHAVLKANATENGNGGKVIIWSDDTTRAYGTIEAKGGANGGDGGFVEVSGKHSLVFQGFADRRAPKGKAGTLLLDPTEVTIDTTAWDNGSGGGIIPSLVGGPVVVQTSGGGSGEIAVLASATFSSANDLRLLAHSNITTGAYSITNTSSGGLYLIAGWDGLSTGTDAAPSGIATGTITASTLSTRGGTVVLKAPDTINVGSIYTYADNASAGQPGKAGGDVFIESLNGAVTVSGTINTSGGDGGSASGSSTAPGIGGDAGDVTINAGTNVTVDYINARGGWGGDGNASFAGRTGGAGGTVSIAAYGTYGSLQLNDNIYADGGEGGFGGGQGGLGGYVELVASSFSISSNPTISAVGGKGGYGNALYGRNGGSGGLGGTIILRATGGDLDFQDVTLDASGGVGGDGGDSVVTGHAATAGGTGGAGGSVSLISDAGGIDSGCGECATERNAYASGGRGGAGGDDFYTIAGGGAGGSGGAAGRIILSGEFVTLQGDLLIEASGGCGGYGGSGYGVTPDGLQGIGGNAGNLVVTPNITLNATAAGGINILGYDSGYSNQVISLGGSGRAQGTDGWLHMESNSDIAQDAWATIKTGRLTFPYDIEDSGVYINGHVSLRGTDNVIGSISGRLWGNLLIDGANAVVGALGDENQPLESLNGYLKIISAGGIAINNDVSADDYVYLRANGGDITQVATSRVFGDYGVDLHASGSVTINGRVESGSGDGGDYAVTITAGMNAAGNPNGVGGNIVIGTSGSIFAERGGSVLVAAGGSAADGNISINGYVGSDNVNPTDSYIEVKAYGDIALNGTIAAEGAVRLQAGIYSSGVDEGYANPRGGNITLGSASRISSNSGNYAITLHAQRGYSSGLLGNITQYGGLIEAPNGKIEFWVGGNAQLDGGITADGHISISAGSAYDEGYGSNGFGGNIALGATSNIVSSSGYVYLEALSGTHATGDITQTAGGIMRGNTGVEIYAEGSANIGGSVTADVNGDGYEVKITAGNGSAGGNIVIGAASVIEASADVRLTTYGGSVELGDITVNGSLSGHYGVNLKAFDGGASPGRITQGAGSIMSSDASDVNIDSIGDITLTGSLVAYDSVIVKAGYDPTPTGDMGNGSFGATPYNARVGNISAAYASIEATGAISGGTITAPMVYLTSYYGGSAGLPAINVTTAADQLIEATVSSGSAFGGIRIQNTGLTSAASDAPGTVNFYDYSSLGGQLAFVHAGDMDASTSINLTGGAGGIVLKATGNLTENGNIFINTPAGPLVWLDAGSNLTINGSAFSLPNNPLTLSASNTLTIASTGNVTATNTTLAGGTINVDGSVAASGDLQAISNSVLNVTGSLSGYGVGLEAPTITLASGSSVTAGMDVGVLAGALQVGGTLSADRDVVIISGTTTLNGGTISAGNDVLLGATTLTGVGGSISAYNYIDLTVAGNATFDGTQIRTDTGDIQLTIDQNLKLNNGAAISAGNDILVTLKGADSTLYLNEQAGLLPSTMTADVFTNDGRTIYLEFLARSSGGIFIDGVETSSATTAGGSGFFWGNPPVIATPGAGLQIVFAQSGVDICQLIPGLCTVPEQKYDDQQGCDLNPGSCSSLLQASLAKKDTLLDDGTIGDGDGEFGDDGKARGKRKLSQCR
jgi:filamentous hemagglutinin family protein